MSLYTEITKLPRDSIIGLTELFKNDKRAIKYNLGVGVYLDENGDVLTPALSASIPPVGSGSAHGAFSGGVFSTEISHPFAFYDNISPTNSQGVDVATSGASVGTSTVGGGYGTALSMLKNKDEFNFNISRFNIYS